MGAEVVCNVVDGSNYMLHLEETVALYICEQHGTKCTRTIVVRILLTGQLGRLECVSRCCDSSDCWL
jgi:hypothetical protein